MARSDTILIPREFPQDETVRVAALCVGQGGAVAAGETVLEVEYSKAAVELASPSAGFARLLCAEGDELPVGALAAEIYPTAAEALAVSEAAPAPDTASDTAPGAAPYLSAKAEDLARLRGLDTGPLASLGLVRSADLSVPAVPPLSAPQPTSAPAASWPEAEAAPLPRAKLAEMAALGAGQNAFASAVEVLVRLPGQGDQAALGGLRSLFVPTLLVRLCGLLRQHPDLNGYYADGAAHRYRAVNLGYALDLGRGLRIAALGDLGAASPLAVRDLLMDRLRAYMRDQLSPAEMTGATFTVSDLSGERVDAFVPLINAGQSGILGICSPDASGLARLVLRFDHRLLEGRAAARFLNALKQSVESPQDE